MDKKLLLQFRDARYLLDSGKKGAKTDVVWLTVYKIKKVMKFKVRFPAPFQVIDVDDDNLDVNIILENDEVYFGTLFTLTNIDKLMEKNREIYFWSTDMLIVKELSYQGIHAALQTVLNEGYFFSVFSKIGLVKDIYSHLEWKDFADVVSEINV